jgi:hypothetical protein
MTYPSRNWKGDIVHPPTQVLAYCHAGTLSAEEREGVDRHAAACLECAGRLEAIGELDAGEIADIVSRRAEEMEDRASEVLKAREAKKARRRQVTVEADLYDQVQYAAGVDEVSVKDWVDAAIRLRMNTWDDIPEEGDPLPPGFPVQSEEQEDGRSASGAPVEFEIRGSRQRRHRAKTCSVTVGPKSADGKAAAWYRVTASVGHVDTLNRTADALVEWLDRHANDSCGDRAPAECVEGGYHYAKIKLLPAGRAAGFYAPGGPR